MNRLSSYNLSLYSSSLINSGEDLAEEHFVQYKPERVLSRTSLFILEYKQFKAAREIQRIWRGYAVRKLIRLRTAAAIMIQKWFRRFNVQRKFFNIVENKLQSKTLEYFDKSATKIQALWRGYWIRQTVHNMQDLKHLQISAAEDLLQCVAFKLHHLLRTHSIPGVYSLRNSNCLSKVEKLLANMNFRFHNDRVRVARLNRETLVENARKKYEKSKYYTETPFGGPNYLGYCTPACEEFTKSYDADKRMYRIIALYEESANADNQVKRVKMSLAEKHRRKKLEEILQRKNSLSRSFCGDVIESMKRWKIIDDNGLHVNNDIFQNPENVENFLDEVQSYLDLFCTSCHCDPKAVETNICH